MSAMSIDQLPIDPAIALHTGVEIKQIGCDAAAPVRRLPIGNERPYSRQNSLEG